MFKKIYIGRVLKCYRRERGGKTCSKMTLPNLRMAPKTVNFQAFHGHTVRGWDLRPECLDKVHERLAYEKKRLKEDGLMIRPDFLVRQLIIQSKW
jgi:hypothetical protein